MELEGKIVLTEEEAAALLQIISMSPIPVDQTAEVAIRKLAAFVTKHTDPQAFAAVK